MVDCGERCSVVVRSEDHLGANILGPCAPEEMIAVRNNRLLGVKIEYLNLPCRLLAGLAIVNLFTRRDVLLQQRVNWRRTLGFLPEQAKCVEIDFLALGGLFVVGLFVVEKV
jgi:hypothetical protein